MKRWQWVHKWTSLACTVFLLVICISGLPLIFIDELGQIGVPSAPTISALTDGDQTTVNLDTMIATARKHYPGEIITSISMDDKSGQTVLNMSPSFSISRNDAASNHWLKFDIHTGKIVDESERLNQLKPAVSPSRTNQIVWQFLMVMLDLHVDWYAGLPGQLFLGFMALVFVAAISSGVVLYGPFMKKLQFGAVRTQRSTRVQWLDLHNLLGIVTLVWAVILGLTGAINEAAGPLLSLMPDSGVRAAWAPLRGSPIPTQNEMSSVQAAVDTAQHALPGMHVRRLLFPDPLPDSDRPYHYWLLLSGRTPLSQQLMTAVMINARTGTLTKVITVPWYRRVIDLSAPLHYGNIGGMPLKIIWAVLDIATIAVLLSGLYLWISKAKGDGRRVAPEHKPGRTLVPPAAASSPAGAVRVLVRRFSRGRQRTNAPP